MNANPIEHIVSEVPFVVLSAERCDSEAVCLALLVELALIFICVVASYDLFLALRQFPLRAKLFDLWLPVFFTVDRKAVDVSS